jgi:hypothetical protein
MELTSPTFHHNERIPSKYTCDGENISPPLVISDVPDEAKSLVLIMDDPDVPPEIRPERMWDHWIIYNIPPETTRIGEGKNPPGTMGKNSYGKQEYGGPCPPPQYEPKEHRYFFKLYALDIMLELPEGATKREVERAMEGHIIAETTLIARYQRE